MVPVPAFRNSNAIWDPKSGRTAFLFSEAFDRYRRRRLTDDDVMCFLPLENN